MPTLLGLGGKITGDHPLLAVGAAHGPAVHRLLAEAGALLAAALHHPPATAELPGQLQPGIHALVFQDMVNHGGDIPQHRLQAVMLGDQLPLHPHPLADIVDNGVKQGAPIELNGAGKDLHITDPAVGPAMLELKVMTLLAVGPSHFGFDLLFGEGVDLADPLKAELLPTPAVVGGGGGVGVDYHPVGRIDNQHHGVVVGEEAAIAGLAFPQGGQAAPVHPLKIPALQGVEDGRTQALEMVLEDIVPGSGPHTGHCGLLVERPGNHQKGDIRQKPPGQLQGLHPVEIGQGEVGENQLRGKLAQGGGKLLSPLHPFHLGGRQHLPHRPLHQLGIAGQILKNQYPYLVAHSLVAHLNSSAKGIGGGPGGAPGGGADLESVPGYAIWR